jgi:hypothetical protein
LMRRSVTWSASSFLGHRAAQRTGS